MSRQWSKPCALLLVAGSLLPSAPAGALPFTSCDQVYSAGLAPLYVGQPGYTKALDRDGDGVACELPNGASNVENYPQVPVTPASSTRYALAACYDSANPIVAQPAGVWFYCRFHSLSDLQWSQWGPEGAVATGTEALKTSCAPSCAESPVLRNPIIIRASNPRLAPDGVGCPSDVLFFSDITISYPASAPPVGSRALDAKVIDQVSFTTDNGVPAVHYLNHPPYCS